MFAGTFDAEAIKLFRNTDTAGSGILILLILVVSFLRTGNLDVVLVLVENGCVTLPRGGFRMVRFCSVVEAD